MTETPLEKVLRLAGPDMTAPVAMGGVVGKGSVEDEAHEHLMGQCPWYAAACDGEDPGDPVNCKNCIDAGEKLTALTPRTPEASTVDQPTVPPGGPGLFHVKGLHLPPYIQHLYTHLVARYGKHDAYRVAVGVVKRWAAGVNPGGWPTKSGKGKRTHPDVQAAAARNVAEWEADKAKGHAEGGQHVKAAAPQATPSFPGQKLLALPPPPKSAAAIMTAHRVHDMLNSLTHGQERYDASCAARKPEDKAYHVIHLRNHLAKVQATGQMLADNLRRNYPAEGKELDAVMEGMQMTRSLAPAIKAATTAHLLQTIMSETAHAARHAELMARPEPADQWKFNAAHAGKHMKGALEHAVKLRGHVLDNYPAEAGWLTQLEDMGAGRHEEASYGKAELAAPAAWPSGTATVSAPGAGKPQALGRGQLRTEPSQTVSPSPPLPPDVDLPTPKELRRFAGELSRMKDDDADHHLTGAVLHLTSAADKMDNNPVSALYSLRSAQTAIQQEWRYRVQKAHPRVAYVFSVDAPPAEQASQQRERAKAEASIGEMQKAASTIAGFIDRVRRRYFAHAHMEPQVAGGGIGISGQPGARL